MSDMEDSAPVNLVPEENDIAAIEHANTECEINVGDKKCSSKEIIVTKSKNVIDSESLQSLGTDKTHDETTKDALNVKNAHQDKQLQDSKEAAENSTQPSILNERKNNDILENFWLENNYKKVVKRIEDGVRTIDDLSRMVQERSEIESFYGNKLKGWSTKWSEIFQRSCEYNLTYKALLRGLGEGDSLAGLQLSVSSKLDALSKQMIQWKNDIYIKQFTKLKEVKRSEDAFVKAQKPWIQKCNEVIKCMNVYHNISGLYDAALKANSHEVASDVAQDQKRLKDKLRKLEEEVSLTRSRYEEAIRDISNYNPKYQDDMKYEFNNCQLFEETRKNFVKESLLSYHACVNRVQFLDSVYTQLKQDYETIDVEKDNKWFQELYGDAHPFESIKFIDYHTTPHDQIKQDVYQNAKKSGVCTTL